MHDEHEVRPRRHAPALLHQDFSHRAPLEGVQVLGALAVQRHLHQRRQPGAQAVGVEQGHAALDHAFVHQAPHPPQGRGRRGVAAFGEFQVGQRGVGLQQVQQLQVGGIEGHSEIIELFLSLV